MNHFQAVNEMRQLANQRNLREIIVEIDWDSTTLECGYNVSGVFKSGDNKVEIFWDAAFQGMTISGPFGSETIRY